MSESKAEISVILPFYQNEEELGKAIESIAEQTFRNWELILVNNNACEKASAIANEWSKNDSRIRIVHESVQGIAYALNTGIRNAKADIIARMDADDISASSRLEKQYALLKSKSFPSVVSCLTDFRSSINDSQGYSLFVDWQNSIITPNQHLLARFIESPVAHPSVMFPKHLISLYGYYDTGDVPEDYELWLRWFSNGVSFYKVPEKLLVWNDHSQRLSRNHHCYSKEAFFKVKGYYLSEWIKESLPANKRIIVCGSSKIIRKRAAAISELGVEVYAYTDIRKSKNRNIRFIEYQTITEPEDVFLINFISKRGVGKAIREHFLTLGFCEGNDFILAG